MNGDSANYMLLAMNQLSGLVFRCMLPFLDGGHLLALPIKHIFDRTKEFYPFYQDVYEFMIEARSHFGKSKDKKNDFRRALPKKSKADVLSVLDEYYDFVYNSDAENSDDDLKFDPATHEYFIYKFNNVPPKMIPSRWAWMGFVIQYHVIRLDFASNYLSALMLMACSLKAI